MSDYRERRNNMKRIGLPAVVALILTIALAGFLEFTSEYPVEEVFKYWVLCGIPWFGGIVVSICVTILGGKILHIDFRKWSGQDLRAAILGTLIVSLFFGFEFHNLLGQSTSMLLFHDRLTVVRTHVDDTYKGLFIWCIAGGLLYVFYRVAERTRYRRTPYEVEKRNRKQTIFLVSKLLGVGAVIIGFTIWIASTELNRRVQFSNLDNKWNTESDSLICVITFQNGGVSHRAYLETMVQVCRKCSKAGARVVVVPLPMNLNYTPSHAKVVQEIVGFDNVVFAVSVDEKTLDPQFEVDPPLDNRVSMDWGVVSAKPFSSWWWWPYKYYPLSYRVGAKGPRVADIAVETMRRYLADKGHPQPLISGGRFSLGEYSTGLLSDGAALIQHRVYPFFPYQFYVTADDNTDSVQYAIGGPEMNPQPNPPEETWRLLEGKIVIIEAGEEITRTGTFAWTYGNIMHNILRGNGTTPVNSWTPLITALMLVIVACLILFLRPWLSLVSIVGLTIGQVYFYSWLAASYGIGIEAAQPVIGTLIGLFAFSFVLIADERKQMDRFEKKRLLEELKAAHDMQMGLLPSEDPKIPGYEISGICKPADEVGGDFFDYVWLDERKTKLGIAIGDVSGKAMKAAITAVLTSGMVYREVGTNETPKSILRKINRPMYLKTERRMFTAMMFAVIDIRKKKLTFSNAGQMQPMLKRRGAIQMLSVDGVRFPLGMMEDVDYHEVSIPLRPKDVVVFYTDGIPEAMNAKNDMFGFERLEAVVKESASDLSAKQVAAKIVEKVAEFAGSAKQHDDMTVVVLKVS
jgi:serine phosphatase RsbU (regulator of sigma subunit)